MSPPATHRPDTLPRWLRSGVLAWAAVLVALLIVAGLLAFLRYEQRAIARDVEDHAQLYARLLEDHTARLLGSTELALQPLAQAASDGGTPAQLSEQMSAVVRGLPFVRSISWLDAQGWVRASSQPGNLGLLVPAAAWQTGPGGLGRLQPARDLAQIARGEAAPAGVAVLPLTLPLPGVQGTLVALLSVDYLANQHQLALASTPYDAAVLAYDSTVLSTTERLRALPGSQAKDLLLFTEFLPRRESGVEQVPGLDGGDTVLAWRAVRRLPLVVLIQTPVDTIDRRLQQARDGALLVGGTVLLLLGASTGLAWRSLRGHERLRADLRQAQGSLDTQEAFTDRLFEVSPVPKAVLDLAGRFVRANRAWCEFVGRDAGCQLGRTATEVLPPDLAEALVARGGQLPGHVADAAQHEVSVRNGEGVQRDLLVRHVPYADAQGQPRGTIVFLFDVTEFREATRRTLEAKEAAEQANAAKSEFIANISHELRTPLQSILGFSEIGMDRAAPDSRERRMFSSVHGGGRRMLTLVEALLDLSQLEATAPQREPVVTDLVPLVREVMAELEPLAQSRDITLTLPSDELPLLAMADPFRLQQVLRNVLANALRFAPAGSTIDTRWLSTAQRHLIVVRDHGPGIPPAELEHIFEPFTQSSRTKDGSGGTGLGLAICRKIMAAHRGGIIARNADGGGAEFEIHLPRL